MTNEEAVKLIEDDKRLHHDSLSGKYREALGMAIEALRKQDVTDTNVGDTVYMKQAIEALTEYGNGRTVYIGVEEAVRRIEQLPSAETQIIHCKECKFAHMTYRGECKYCDIWFPDEKFYMDGDYYCASAERRTNEND